MESSFNVNQADLQKILEQIKVAEAHSAANGTKSLLQIIMETFNVSAADAALMPVGLRTVDGSDNSLLPGQNFFGAADQLFPRLTDPVFVNDADGDAFGPITNNNYGSQTSVADADPRIISNLIVDMTAGNPAAVEAALRYAGHEGDISGIRDAIVAAYRNIAATAAAAHAAQQAEEQAQATLATETSEQAAADAANDAAQATLAAYNAALAANADNEATDTKNAVQAVVTAFGAVGSIVNQADRDAIDAAVVQATQARDAAQTAFDALLANLGAAHPDMVAAQSVLTNAQTLLSDLTTLESTLDSFTPNLEATEHGDAAAANSAAGSTASLADANTTQLLASQALAETNVSNAATALADAQTALTAAQGVLTNATQNRITAETNLADAQVLYGQKQAIASAAQTTLNNATTAHQPYALTVSSYQTAIAQDVDGGLATSLQSALDNLITNLSAVDIAIEQADITAIDDAITSANQVLTAANTAVSALMAGSPPNGFVDAADLAAAHADAANVLAIRDRLVTLKNELTSDIDGLVDAADFTEASDILAATQSAALAAASNATALATSLTDAQADAVPTAADLAAAQTALDTANAEVEQVQHLIFGVFDEQTNTLITPGLVHALADAQAAELAATNAVTNAQQDVTDATTANQTAQAILAAYTAALAQDVEVKTLATQTEVGQLVASLGNIGSVVDAADHQAAAEAVNAATVAADAATNAANALAAQLGLTHADVIAAQAVADAAVAVQNQLTALQSALLQSNPLLDQNEFDAAQAALTLAISNETQANNVDAQLNLAQDSAETVANGTAASLAQADAELQAAQTAYNNAVSASNAADAARDAARPAFDTLIQDNELQVEGIGSLVIPNLSPDVGLTAGFNSWMTYFGQFFDHGLDLVTKGNNGTVFIPLQADDPLIAGADGVFGTEDDLPPQLQFMPLTRATVTVDENGIPQHTNTTTSFVDQNQTYTSHAAHQVFLREYQRVGDQTFATGHLLDGKAANGSLDGAIGNWAEVKAQAIEMLGIKLSDFDVHSVPLLVTDPYGKFIPGDDGYAQVVVETKIINDLTGQVIGTGAPFTMSGVAGGLDLANLANPSGLPALPAGQSYKTVVVSTGHAFLDDIAHHANIAMVNHDNNSATPRIQQTADVDVDLNRNGVYDAGIDTFQDFNNDNDNLDAGEFFSWVGDDFNNLTYDDELLNSHFITGDGRGNENIALTAVHSVFHQEHNRTVEANKLTILQSGDLAFINEWLRVDLPNLSSIPSDPAQLEAFADTLAWDGERLFQAARFTTEMQYQHLVFEEFARRIQPDVDPFVFNNTPEIDASILAEFAHTVYRFGHSMLTGTVDRLENDLTTVNGEADQQTLLAAFLNPQMYLSSGATLEEVQANLVRGLSRDLGNEIDEFIVQDVRSNLLGLPLDLGALNIARGRDTGIPSLNETRQQLHEAGVSTLNPYASWNDFTPNLKNPLSIVNFIAAYGTHASITSATTLADMRDAAMLLVFGDGNNSDGVTIRGVTYNNQDRLDFLNGVGAYAANKGGMDLVDLWIGGLAEQKNEFGGMLGETFNYIFEYQMEHLQFGDRMYYLTRTQGMNLLNQLEPNTFTDLVMRNSALGDKYATHLSGSLFLTPDLFLELDRGIAQEDYNGAADGRDPLPEPGSDEPRVERDYTNSTVVDGNHDFGGSIKYFGGEHTVVGGTEGDDYIQTDKGDDTVWGDGGNDHIVTGEGADQIFGGDGDDIIESGFLDDMSRGGRGNDIIVDEGGAGADLLFGEAGHDYLQLENSFGEVFAGEGNDFILGGTAADFLLGNEGDDWIEGGPGFDTLAGENSELFFNSPIIGHDVLFGQGDETDFDAESGDDIMGSGPSVFRYEGMFGFDWTIAKNDNQSGLGVNFDLGIPIFSSAPADVLRDRFDLVEGVSGWKDDDVLTGDNRGHIAGTSTNPGATTTDLFIDNELNAEGIDRIDGLRDLMGSALTTYDLGTTFRDGNILLGGDGNDVLRGKGGYDILDGDAWLNVRIKIVIDSGPHAGTYSAESLTIDTRYAGATAGKVFHTDANGDPIFTSPAFDGRSLQSLLLDRTINPGQMSIVREILHDTTPGNNNDTARFSGTLAEYDIEGRGVFVDLNDDGDLLDLGEDVAQRAYDLNGDGFISVTDRDNGSTGAVVLGVQLLSRGINTDDTDLLKNIEVLSFADQTIAIAGNNQAATGTVAISDPTPFGTQVTPVVGQVLTPSLLPGFADADGIPLGGDNLPVGLTYEWQTTEPGTNRGWTTVQISSTFTVRPQDVGFSIRAVAVFKDSAGVTERIYSAPSGEITMPFSLNENSPTGTVVGIVPITAGEVGATHAINGNNDAGGRFAVVQNGTDAQGNPLFQIVVANGGPVLLDYEAVQTPVENEYQIVVDSFNDENELFATRQFTIRLNDLANEGIPTTINWTGVTPANNALPGAGTVIGNLSTIDPDVGQTHQYQTLPGSAANFTVSTGGVVTRTGEAMAPNSTYLLHVRTTDNIGVTLDETFTIRTLANGVANIFTGTSGDDIVYGMTGNDTLNGGSGDDNLFGQGGADILNGDAGNDILSGGSGADSLNGGSGNDTLRYTIGDGIDTVLNGGADTDTIDIQANGGAQTLAVTYNGTAITNFEGNGAFTSIERFTANLGAGNDTLVYTSAAGVVVDLSTATASGFASVVGIENVTGGAGSDQLTGDTNANTLSGGTGNDTLVATVDDVRDTLDGGGNTDTANYAAYAAGLTVNLGGAAPIVVGGSGSTPANSDVLVAIENFTGGTGADSITGSGAANVLRGGDGADTLNGAGGNDQLFGEAGNDTITYVIGGGADTVDGGADTDTLNINGQANNDVLDVIYNAVGLITVFEGSTVTGVETINVDLGGNADTISYAGSALGVTVNLATGTASGLSSIVNVSNVTGTAQADNLSGNSSANTLNGGAGNDTITYVIGGGADTVDGGADTDTLNITDGTGNNTLDVLYDGTVITLLEGGTISNIEIVNANMGGASDTLSYAGSTAGVTVDLADGAGIGTASGFTQLINVTNVTGTAQADSLSGNSSANTLTGGGGNDQLNGEGGADTLDGGAGADTLNGGGGGDTLIGGADADSLNGGAAADILIGGAGADAINTGAANDNVADLIRFSTTDEFGDTITNFDATGTAAQVDRVEFGNGLNTAWDDRTLDDNVQFATGNGALGTVTVDMDTTAEALLLTGAGGEGVTTANLGNTALVAAAFNAEFAITAADGEDALLVINDTNGNSASVWQWVQNTTVVGNTAGVDANELTLIGVVNANATVTTASFDFF